MQLPLLENTSRTKFHISLNVRNLDRAIGFYRILFAMEPAKHHDDYAKFEVEDPPVVFSLSPRNFSCTGVLSNIGIQVVDEATLASLERRLSEAGISSRMQTDALCGYARQVKLWVEDPDGNHWELYVPGEDVDPRIIQRSAEGPSETGTSASNESAVWEHQLSDGAIDTIPATDGSLDEVRLSGTFNSSLSQLEIRELLSEAFRALKVAGTISIHGLASDRSFPGANPQLPGIAAVVQQVPLETEVLGQVVAAGFVGVTITKLAKSATFTHDGVEMREQKVMAWKPARSTRSQELREVMYKGPLASVSDDSGIRFRRGKREQVPLSIWTRLRDSSAAEQFLFLQPHGNDAASTSCGTTICS